MEGEEKKGKRDLELGFWTFAFGRLRREVSSILPQMRFNGLFRPKSGYPAHQAQQK